MPLWAKIVAGVLGLGFVLLVAAGILIPKMLQRSSTMFYLSILRQVLVSKMR